jgi:hypothetical protein
VDDVDITCSLLTNTTSCINLHDLLENSLTEVFLIIYNGSLRRPASSWSSNRLLIVRFPIFTSQFFEKPKFPDNSRYSMNIDDNATRQRATDKLSIINIQ